MYKKILKKIKNLVFLLLQSKKNAINYNMIGTVEKEVIQKFLIEKKFSFLNVKPNYIPTDRHAIIYPDLSARYIDIFKVYNAKIVPYDNFYPVAISKEGKLIIENFDVKSMPLNKRVLRIITDDQIQKNYSKSPVKTAKKLIVLTSPWTHYGHWLPEYLIRLTKLEYYCQEELKDAEILLEKNYPKWKLDILEALGFKKNKIKEYDGSVIAVEQMICMDYFYYDFSEYEKLTNKLKSIYPKKSHAKNLKIYLSRNKLERKKGRYVINEVELINFLSSEGFKVLHPEELSIFEQFHIFANSKIIIGPHGSAFANIVYCKSATVIEFFGKSIPLAFYKLALEKKLNYLPLYCDLKKSNYVPNKGKEGYKDMGLFVDISKLRGLLRSISDK